MQFLAFVPLIFVNIWHGVVIAIARHRGGVWRSISESALVGNDTLLIHRIMHVVGALCFYGFGIWLCADQRFHLSAGILFIAATFDITQALALNKNTQHTPINMKDIHQLTAWVMAVGYLLFSVVFMRAVGVRDIIIWSYIVWLLAVYCCSLLIKHRYFWMTQMVFFISVEIVVLITLFALFAQQL
ncbi:MAG: hypothetical protein WAW62_03150 [Candidatus Saccharimonas aalborgensis]